MTILLLAALLPPLFLMIKIYKLDKVEKEPGGLIVKLLIFGVLTTVPAAFLEGFLISLVGGVISPKTTLFILVENFFCVGLVEEGVKYFALKKGSWNHPAFNYTFDGIVYAVAVSIGFAAAENVLYVMEYGMATAGVRAVTSIPGHCIFAIYMGISFSLAKYCEVHGNLPLRKKTSSQCHSDSDAAARILRFLRIHEGADLDHHFPGIHRGAGCGCLQEGERDGTARPATLIL